MRRTAHIAAVLLLACAACKASTATTTKPAASKTRSGTAGASASGEGQGSATSGSSGSGAAGSPASTMDAGASPSSQSGAKHDAGTNAGPDAGTTMVTMRPDASAGDAAPDALVGTLGTGSCCQEQTTPGCDNADLQVCVCEKIPACCTTAWSKACVLIVQQKYCQPGVRDCVCGTNVDAGQWGQTSCCDTAWTDTCNTVAEIKCSAVVGCF